MQDEDRAATAGVEAVDGTVGERLRAAREAAGLTVEQVSATTRIRPPVLRDLEADRLGTADTAVYVRGHLRAAARAVGTDPGPLVRAFDERVGASAPALAVEAPGPVPGPRRPSGGLAVPLSAPPEREEPRWLLAVLGVLAVLVVLLLVGSLSGDDEPREDALTVPSAAPTVPGTGTGSGASAPAPAPPAPAPTGAELVLTARGTSWLSVRAADATLFEGTVQQGWTERFADPARVEVRIGNAAAVESSCGGAPGPTGDPGAVLALTCTPQGLLQS